MNPHGYLDSNTIINWFVGSVPTASEHVRQVREGMVPLVQNRDRQLAISELTLIEVHDGLAKHLRMGEHPSCDDSWFDASMGEFMRAISEGIFAVLDTPPRGISHAMVLGQVATREQGRKFTMADALHLITAVCWSSDITEQVDFFTSDTDFQGFMDEVPGFATFVNLVYLP